MSRDAAPVFTVGPSSGAGHPPVGAATPANHITLLEPHNSAEAAPLYRELGFSGRPALLRMTRHSGSGGATDLGERPGRRRPCRATRRGYPSGRTRGGVGR